MAAMKRRDFLKALAAAGLAAGMAPAALAQPARSAGNAHVIVIGGGFGGATAARYLKLWDPALRVTLIERDRQYVTCPMSNDYIGGNREFDTLVHGYETLRNDYGVEVLHDSVVAIEPTTRRVVTEAGGALIYDRLIVSPGIDFLWEAIEGYDVAAAQTMPHAWKAGEQTRLLRRQLQDMPNGGLFVMVAPPNPFRCPPGPYERASLIANYFTTYKRDSKILILDQKDSFTKQDLFVQGWDELYPRGMIEWVPASQGGTLKSVDPGTMTLVAEAGTFRADVVNLIPPQYAGLLAHTAGLVDQSGFCPVNQQTFESLIHPGIHVIGDSSVAGAMPKSGVSANTQAKVVAQAVHDVLVDMEPGPPSLMNACFSLVSPSYGISIAAVYQLIDGEIAGVEGAGGVSPMDATPAQRRLEAVFWRSWYQNIVHDTFG